MVENRPVRIGMMSFAHMHAAGYAAAVNQLTQAELAGIADDNEERGRDMAKRFGTEYVGGYEALLGRDIDAVIVCSENVRHRELTVMAAQAGKHVMCEKPLVTTIEDGRAMIDECKKHGVKLQTAFPCRFGSAMIQARQAVVDGKIGKVLAVKGTNRGKCPGGWFIDPALSGGGAVTDHTVHVVDLMRWTLQSEVTEVYAEVGNLMFGKDFDDVGMLSLGFDNGVFATLDPSWSRPKSYPFWGDVTMDVIGHDGMVRLDLFGQKIEMHSDRTMRGSWEYWGDNLDLGLVRSFVNSVANDLPVEVTGEDGLAAAAVALAAYESARRAAPVKLSEIG